MDVFEQKESDLVPIKELDLFYTPPTEGAIQRKRWIQYRPTANITEGSPLEFIIPGSGSQYLDLKHTYLSLLTRIVKEDGSRTTNIEKVAPVNLTLHSMFNQVDLFLNQKLTSTAGVNYPYKSLIDTLLNSSTEASKSGLQAEGFHIDEAGFMDETDPLEGANPGLTRRFISTNHSKLTQYMGPLHLDLAEQDRFILNGVEMKLALWPTKETFRLMVAADDVQYKMEIVEAVLHVCKITINPSIIAAHNEALETSPALYPYERSQIKTFEVSSGKSSFDI
jgi:hypothetical protein